MVDYELGTSKRFSISWRDESTGDLIDPDDIGKFRIFDGDLSVLVDQVPLKQAVGQYFYDVALTEANGFYVGRFMYEWSCEQSSFPIIVRTLFGVQKTRPP
jgi:hypothetical protein